MPRSASRASRRAHIVRLAALLMILVGFGDLARGGIVLAPLALVVGYLVLVPLSFFID
ncbi:MAG TPA: hypothetical protein VF461_17300 [Gemmatimonadaceae bacterium]